jgi:ABC-2 type transport system ATP-binding protein
MELKIEKLSMNFKDVKAVNNVSYTMHKGVYGLLGLNGAGKTTLMRMLCTLLQPTSGRILCNGKDIFEIGAEYRNLLGYLPQDFGYYPDFTVKDYLLYISSIKGIKSALAKKVIDDLLSQVGLKKVQNRKMKKLSGGMKRRAGIAQAMINNPQILILDEPTAGLDPNERIRFRNLISELSQERLVLLSTHIVSDIEYIANEILFMKEGTILYAGSPEKVIREVPINAWSFQINKSETNDFIKHYKVVNIKSVNDRVEIRILSKEKPHINAKKEVTTLEDVFLYYFGEKVGEEDVVL